MSNSPNLQLDAENYYLLRRPLLPLQTALQLHETSKSASQLLPTLLEHFRAPLLQEAIYTASPELYDELLKALTREEPFGKNAEKLALTLHKYLVRMSTRCTPYGLFAGCTRGQLAEHTAIIFSEHPLRTQSRLDMNYVSEIVQHLLATPSLKEQLLYYPNNSLYRVADKYRYVEYQVESKRRTYKLSSVEHSTYLEAIVTAAREGCGFLHLVEIVQAIEPTASEDDAQAFVEQIIDSQILVSELEPTITGAPYLDTLPDRLQGKVST
ncbi:MAG TPA: lantibiotic dehydratase, partial [Hymenobacter sp.]